MSFSDLDRRWMRRALALARRGRGRVEPNPMVGAVVIRNGEPIAEGWHRGFGKDHAEVDALRRTGASAGDTLVVTLEPCHHRGKTPPCTQAILDAGIHRVVVGMPDPNRDVRGGGMDALREAGVRVDAGCLEEEVRELNAPYVKRTSTGLPYVTAKWAMSLDGRLAARTGDSRWISSEASRRIVHRLRGEVDAILVGVGTALADDPRLTCRTRPRRLARRIVADSQGRTPPACRLLTESGGGEVVLAVSDAAPPERRATLEAAGASVWVLPEGEGGIHLPALLSRIGEEGGTNLLVEGGSTLLGAFFREDLVDRVLCFIAPCILGGSRHPAAGWGLDQVKDAGRLERVRVSRPGGDLLVRGILPRRS